MTSIFANLGRQNSAPNPNNPLFGATRPDQNNNQQQQNPPGTGLFQNTTTPQQQNQPQQTSNLFGGSTTTQPKGTGLFGSSTHTPQPQQTSSLFGGQTAQPQQQTSSLFGGSTSQPQQQTSNLFGGQTSQPQQQTSSLFGGQATQPQQQTSSLFGGQASQPQQQTSSLFGGQQNQQQQPSNSLFSSLNQNQQNQSLASTFNGSTTNVPQLQAQQQLAASQLQAHGLSNTVREKSIGDQVKTLVDKWDPNSGETLLRAYLYNGVNPAYAPFYHPDAAQGETEKEWDEALARKPPNTDDHAFVPILTRGFGALKARIETQKGYVQSMQLRLHEMNYSLQAVMTKHQQEFSVRLEGAKRKHAALSQRCLRLAVKSQILRNRGYALDGQEESLRRQLMELAKKVEDPAFTGREEEIWARMVALRERARWLEEEGKRLGAQAEEQQQRSVPDHVIETTKRILKDYDEQLVHLGTIIECRVAQQQA